MSFLLVLLPIDEGTKSKVINNTIIRKSLVVVFTLVSALLTLISFYLWLFVSDEQFSGFKYSTGLIYFIVSLLLTAGAIFLSFT